MHACMSSIRGWIQLGILLEWCKKTCFAGGILVPARRNRLPAHKAFVLITYFVCAIFGSWGTCVREPARGHIARNPIKYSWSMRDPIISAVSDTSGICPTGHQPGWATQGGRSECSLITTGATFSIWVGITGTYFDKDNHWPNFYVRSPLGTRSVFYSPRLNFKEKIKICRKWVNF